MEWLASWTHFSFMDNFIQIQFLKIECTQKYSIKLSTMKRILIWHSLRLNFTGIEKDFENVEKIIIQIKIHY